MATMLSRSGRSRVASPGPGGAAAPVDLALPYLYRAELAVRTGDPGLAGRSLDAAEALDLTVDETAARSDESVHVTEIVRQD